ncbi:sensor histidine kinase [Deinococcus yunweiensis]|uniref:sensor histidine kinase n=1 Tax=Deinococcus yunweiensis TaxID=367282 RepID=UPI00398EF80A
MPRRSTSPVRYAVAAFDALSAHVAILDERGVVLAVNRAWEVFAQNNGGSSELGTNYLELCRQVQGPDQTDALSIADGIMQVIRAEIDTFEWEYPCHSPTEQRFFVARVTRFVQDGQTYVLVAHENITRRKVAELEVRELNRTLEARVHARTQELEASQRTLEQQNRALELSNDELSQFAAVASHDLQEPLRTLSLHADMLLERHLGRPIDERAERHLRHIIAQASRARRLVQDVLTMTELSVTASMDVVDLGAILPDVISALDWPASAPPVWGDLPAVWANAGQMHQLLMNLLGNALKYSQPRDVSVSVSGLRTADTVTFEVADAGTGIPEEHRTHVFELFRRLHNRTPTSGNGIGLTVCSKIIERHGGRIWITGNARGGTSVHFTLPAAPHPVGGPHPESGTSMSAASQAEVSGERTAEAGTDLPGAGIEGVPIAPRDGDWPDTDTAGFRYHRDSTG